MTFEQYVIEVFTDHHDSMGVSLEEIQDLVEESTHKQRIKWLEKNGYDLVSDYDNYVSLYN